MVCLLDRLPVFYLFIENTVILSRFRVISLTGMVLLCSLVL